MQGSDLEPIVFSQRIAIVMRSENHEVRTPRRGWLRPMLGDVHFWVPLVALLGGALILYLVQ